MKKVIFSENAPKVVGPYSQAISTGEMVFCSGQIAMNPVTGTLEGDTIETQTEQVLKNLAAVLKEAGCTLSDVVQTQCFLANMNYYPKFNEIYANYFAESKPARYTVGVDSLPANALVEIAVIAQVKKA